jgi:Haem-degrading
VRAALGGTDVGCTGLSRAKNGIQIFPGSVPIYRGNTLVGAIGVSGDGVDQDDMIAFLGLANAGKVLNNGIANAPASIRADKLQPQGAGSRLRYVQCPQAPFNDSSEQNVCEGL